MKPPPFEYHAVDTLDEAVSLLAEHGDDAKVLAGGQSLVPLLAIRLARPEHVIDINRIGDLAEIGNGEGVHLGAVVRQRQVERSDSVATSNPLLAAAIRLIGHAAIRNRGTVAGSIAHADPAAELPTVLIALDGTVDAVSRRGTRTIGAADLFAGFLSTSLEPDELLAHVHFPAWEPGAGAAFHEFSRRSGDFAIAGAAAVVTLDREGAIANTRIALSGMGATPIRAFGAERLLIGQRPGDQAWSAAAAEAVRDLEPPADIHGGSRYRAHLAQSLVRRALGEAASRAEVPV